nr:NADH dehydrogenase subunit 4L [Goniodes ortygis]
MTKVFLMICMFCGMVKVSTTNSFLLTLISLEMMMFSIVVLLSSQFWLSVNTHFYSSILVMSVLESVIGLCILVMMFSNSEILVSGVMSNMM